MGRLSGRAKRRRRADAVAEPTGASPPRIFLDANILFSAALGGPAFELLWELAARGRVALVTNPGCVAEARVNLERKRAAALPSLLVRLAAVGVAEDVEAASDRALDLLPPDDAVVLDAAWRARADVLVTGDLRHFGALMRRRDLGLRVLTVRDFLLEGPP